MNAIAVAIDSGRCDLILRENALDRAVDAENLVTRKRQSEVKDERSDGVPLAQ